MNMKTSILTIFALAASVASAQTLTIPGDTLISESATYKIISITATSDATVSIADNAKLTFDGQSPLFNVGYSKKLTISGGSFVHQYSDVWSPKYISNNANVVFDTDFTYNWTSSAGSQGATNFMVGGGKWAFQKGFTLTSVKEGTKFHLQLGYTSGSVGGSTEFTFGSKQNTITESTPMYSTTIETIDFNNPSTLVIENNYSVITNSVAFLQDGSVIKNYGSFTNNGANDINASFTNAGTATFTAAEVIVSGSYTNSGGTTNFGTNAILSGAYYNTSGTSKMLGTSSIRSTYSNTGGTTIFTEGTRIEDGAKLVVGGDNSAVVSGGIITVKSGGTIELDGGKLSAGVSLNTGSTLSIKKASTTTWVNVTDGATIEMWASSTYTYSLFGNTTVKVLADNLTLQGMAWKESGSHEVDIVLNGHSFNFGGMTRGQGFTGEDLFIDFILAENESWKDNSVKTTMSEAQLNEITFKINGVITEFDFVATTDGFYLNTVVPEPAEWAMIFGAVALAFVAYRRRR